MFYPMTPRKRRAYRASPNAVSNRIVTAALYPLTPREAEVTGWIAAGKRNKEIATTSRGPIDRSNRKQSPAVAQALAVVQRIS
jgi:FixJ family two-component response regulator